MSRSTKKGPYVDEKLLNKVMKQKAVKSYDPIKTWARRCTVVPEFVSHTFLVHNGNKFVKVFVTEDMVGHRLGEFSLTRKFIKHGGKMQKDLEAKKKEDEINAVKSAKEAVAAKK